MQLSNVPAVNRILNGQTPDILVLPEDAHAQVPRNPSIGYVLDQVDRAAAKLAKRLRKI